MSEKWPIATNFCCFGSRVVYAEVILLRGILLSGSMRPPSPKKNAGLGLAHFIAVSPGAESSSYATAKSLKWEPTVDVFGVASRRSSCERDRKGPIVRQSINQTINQIYSGRRKILVV